MIDHNFTQYGIDETYAGEVVLPSEKGNTHVTMPLRQFVQLARRAYSANALAYLEDDEGLKITEHQTMDDNEYEEVQPFFHFSLTFRPNRISLKDFVESPDGDKVWYLNDKYHRENGPAIELANGTKVWYLEGKCQDRKSVV